MRFRTVTKNDEMRLMPIATFAHAFLAQFPGQRFCGVGQAPAWIAEAIKIESSLNKLNSQGLIAPFSSSICSDLGCLSFEIEDRPSEQALDWYGELLTNYGVAPKQVMTAYTKQKKKTLIFDSVCSGEGLASFLSAFMLLAAREKLRPSIRRAIRVVPLIYSGSAFCVRKAKKISVANVYTIPVFPLGVPEKATASSAFFESNGARLSPHCALEEWNGDHPTLCQNVQVDKTRAKLEALIEKNFAKQTKRPKFFDMLVRRVFGKNVVAATR